MNEEKEDAAFLELLADANKRQKRIEETRTFLNSRYLAARKHTGIGALLTLVFLAASIRFNVGRPEILGQIKWALLLFARLFFLFAVFQIAFAMFARSEKRLLLLCEFLEKKLSR